MRVFSFWELCENCEIRIPGRTFFCSENFKVPKTLPKVNGKIKKRTFQNAKTLLKMNGKIKKNTSKHENTIKNEWKK